MNTLNPIQAYLITVINTAPLKPNISPVQLNKLYQVIIREPFLASRFKTKTPGRDKYLDMIIMKLVLDHQNIFWNEIFSDFSTDKGKFLSQVSGLRKKENSINYVYGEAVLPTLYEILMIIKPGNNTVFYDLGSGTGRAVFAMHLLHRFKKTVGIELIETLYQASMNVKQRYAKLVGPMANNINFIHGDILKTDWSDGDVFFVNATCFDEALMKGISQLADKCKKGTWFITTTKTLVSNKYRLIDQRSDKYSWGVATTNIQVKIL